MGKPTPKQISQWQRTASDHADEATHTPGEYHPDWGGEYDAQLCRLAAAWAREQALEEAAKAVCDYDVPIWPSARGEMEFHAIVEQLPNIAEAIRALKEPSNG